MRDRDAKVRNAIPSNSWGQQMKTKFRDHQLLFALIAICTACSAGAEGRPADVSPQERHAILDALRPSIETALGAPIQFVVKELRVDEGFAYVNVNPQRPNGTAVKIQRPDWMNAYADAVLEKKGDKWSVLEYRVGATDVWQCKFAGTVPKYVLGKWC